MLQIQNIVHRKRDIVSAPLALFGRRPARYTFIVGCGHTGSTLLARILYGHPDIHSARYETGAFQPTLPKFHELARLYRDAVGAGKDMLVEKTPRHVHRARAIRFWLPQARFIVTVRDGRDVVASLAARYGSFEQAFERWTEDTRASIAVVEQYGGVVFRLEDLIAAPEAQIRRLCSFLDLEFSDRLLDYSETKVQWGPPGDDSEHTRLRQRQVNSPISDTSGRWRVELTPEQIARFRTPDSSRLGQAFGYDYADSSLADLKRSGS